MRPRVPGECPDSSGTGRSSLADALADVASAFLVGKVGSAHGGRTRLADLILLCEAHHMVVHRRGYRISASAAGGFVFARHDGARVPSSPDLPGADGDIASCHDAAIRVAQERALAAAG